jgi:hypothetical protein
MLCQQHFGGSSDTDLDQRKYTFFVRLGFHVDGPPGLLSQLLRALCENDFMTSLSQDEPEYRNQGTVVYNLDIVYPAVISSDCRGD